MAAEFKRVEGFPAYPSSEGGWEEYYTLRGIGRAGIPEGTAGIFKDDFVELSQWYKVGGVASFAGVMSDVGGVAELAVGAGDTVVYQNGDFALGSPTLVHGYGKFYIACRFKFPVALAADGALSIGGLSPTGQVLAFGYYPTVDATHPVLVINDGVNPEESAVSTILSGVGWHEAEFWCDGSKYYLSVDDETPVVLDPTNPLSEPLAALIQGVGGAAAGVTLDLDRILYLMP